MSLSAVGNRRPALRCVASPPWRHANQRRAPATQLQRPARVAATRHAIPACPPARCAHDPRLPTPAALALRRSLTPRTMPRLTALLPLPPRPPPPGRRAPPRLGHGGGRPLELHRRGPPRRGRRLARPLHVRAPCLTEECAPGHRPRPSALTPRARAAAGKGTPATSPRPGRAASARSTRFSPATSSAGAHCTCEPSALTPDPLCRARRGRRTPREDMHRAGASKRRLAP